MRRIKVRMPVEGTAEQSTEIGEIADSGIAWGNGRGQLRGEAIHELIVLLGNGYRDKRFHLTVGQQGLGGCKVTAVGRVLDFTYGSLFTFKE
jgi:hypothetical protein